MKSIVIFGASGGLGRELTELLSNGYMVKGLSSKDGDISHYNTVPEEEADYIINLSCLNIDSSLHRAIPMSITRQVEVNCLGASFILQKYLKYFRDIEKPGKIILMSSFLSTRPVKGAGIYAATKSFTDSLVRTAAVENAKYGITVNSIQAGYFDAGLTHKLPVKILDEVRSRIPVGRFGRAEELASAIRFIFDNDYVTGTNLVIDGGVSLV